MTTHAQSSGTQKQLLDVSMLGRWDPGSVHPEALERKLQAAGDEAEPQWVGDR